MSTETIVWGCIAAVWLVAIVCMWADTSDTTESYEHSDWLDDIAAAEVAKRRAREDKARVERALADPEFTDGDRKFLTELRIIA